jgi:hypothetical protein
MTKTIKISGSYGHYDVTVDGKFVGIVTKHAGSGWSGTLATYVFFPAAKSAIPEMGVGYNHIRTLKDAKVQVTAHIVAHYVGIDDEAVALTGDIL